jgi:hypothetical protein
MTAKLASWHLYYITCQSSPEFLQNQTAPKKLFLTSSFFRIRISVELSCKIALKIHAGFLQSFKMRRLIWVKKH